MYICARAFATFPSSTLATRTSLGGRTEMPSVVMPARLRRDGGAPGRQHEAARWSSWRIVCLGHALWTLGPQPTATRSWAGSRNGAAALALIDREVSQGQSGSVT